MVTYEIMKNWKRFKELLTGSTNKRKGQNQTFLLSLKEKQYFEKKL